MDSPPWWLCRLFVFLLIAAAPPAAPACPPQGGGRSGHGAARRYRQLHVRSRLGLCRARAGGRRRDPGRGHAAGSGGAAARASAGRQRALHARFRRPAESGRVRAGRPHQHLYRRMPPARSSMPLISTGSHLHALHLAACLPVRIFDSFVYGYVARLGDCRHSK